MACCINKAHLERPPRNWILALLFIPLLISARPAYANSEQKPTNDLTELTIEALMDIEVTSVSRKPQSLANTAAAVYVINQEDIRRSGAITIPDLLRMVPGVQVARIDANKWAISIRGGNGRFDNKLQVLKDGRSLYTPLFAGVYWETLDTTLEDIERIEVVRGPGAAMWGANAVNGVINIITKRSSETQGGLASGGYGRSDRGFGTLRYGFKPSENSMMRLYGKYVDRGEGVYSNGTDANDAWHLATGGFRLDSTPTHDNKLTLQSDFHTGRMNETYTFYHLQTLSDPSYSWTQPSTSTDWGANLLTRWEHSLSGTDNLSLQMYYDHIQRDFYILGEKRDTVDLDFQHRFAAGHMQDIIWGVGYRYSHDTLQNSQIFSLENTSNGDSLFSAFLHDEITLLPNTLSVILESRLEHNHHTGFEIQPSGRLIWTPSPQNTIWGSISRAVRSPARVEMDLRYTYLTLPPGAVGNPLPLRVEIDGNSSFRSETLLAYDVGYRSEITKQVSLDLSLFFNQYDHLRVRQEGTTTLESPTNLVLKYPLGNDMHGHSYGAELAVNWQPYDWWRLQAGYNYLRAFMYLHSGSTDDINRLNAADGAPRNQFTLRSGFNFGRHVEMDFWFRSVERVNHIDQVTISGYVTMDSRIAWKPTKNIELALVGQNLFKSRHPEYVPETVNTTPSEVPRSIYGKVTLNF
jgi:iron complex outermembrane receptor protein